MPFFSFSATPIVPAPLTFAYNILGPFETPLSGKFFYTSELDSDEPWQENWKTRAGKKWATLQVQFLSKSAENCSIGQWIFSCTLYFDCIW